MAGVRLLCFCSTLLLIAIGSTVHCSISVDCSWRANNNYDIQAHSGRRIAAKFCYFIDAFASLVPCHTNCNCSLYNFVHRRYGTLFLCTDLVFSFLLSIQTFWL